MSVAALSSTAHAVRPFVTDDGEVVGDRQVEIATWLEFGSHFFEHNLELTVGVTPWLEIGTGAVQGIEHGEYGLSGPIFHIKASLRDLPENGWTGAINFGGAPPLALGAYKPHDTVLYVSSILTYSFLNGDVLLHANLGVGFAGDGVRGFWAPNAAIATQFHIASLFYGVTEVFYSDPMDPRMEFGGQLGVRLMISEDIQVDATTGTELTLQGQWHPWGTLGVRFVLGP